MNTHPVHAELRQQAENFKSPEHPAYRPHETDLHHEVRRHAIDVIQSNLESEHESPESLERLGADMDAFTGEVAAVAAELQRGIRKPGEFRQALREKAESFGTPMAARPGDNERSLTLTEIKTYLDFQQKEIAAAGDERDPRLSAIGAVDKLVGIWQARLKIEHAQLSVREVMHSPLDKPERDDLQRVQQAAQSIGEESLQFTADRLTESPDQSAEPERSSANRPEVNLEPKLYAKLMKASENNTLIYTSLADNSTATSISGEPSEHLTTIGDAPENTGSFLPVGDLLEEAASPTGLHIRRDPGTPDISNGLPEVACLVPQISRETTPGRKKTLFSPGTPDTYNDVAVTVFNPITKETEPVVDFLYSYAETRISDVEVERELTYADPATGRSGNVLQVRVPLPKSLADELQEELINDPIKVRGFVESLVKERGNVAPGEWDGSSNSMGIGVRPPVFIDDERRSPQAQQLAASPRILTPVDTSTGGQKLDTMAFKVIA